MGATVLLTSVAPLTASAQGGTYTTSEVTDGRTTFIVVDNPGDGPTLSYSPDSTVTLLEEVVGPYTHAFEDLDADGQLDDWEDWRKSYDERAKSPAQELTIEQIAGLMLFSSHEPSPEAGLTDAQQAYLKSDQLRNVLNAGSNLS